MFSSFYLKNKYLGLDKFIIKLFKFIKKIRTKVNLNTLFLTFHYLIFSQKNKNATLNLVNKRFRKEKYLENRNREAL